MRKQAGSIGIRTIRILTIFILILLPLGFAADCMGVINISGNYLMTQDMAGAPNSATPLSGNVCIKINVSDVVLNCNGHSITNNGVGGITYGILLAGSPTNVTVKNCAGVSNYTYGIYVYNSVNSTISNCTAYSNTQSGFQLVYSTAVTVFNSTADNNNGGFYIQYGGRNAINNNTVHHNSGAGIFVQSSSLNSVYGNQVYDGPSPGIHVYYTNNENNFTNNAVFNNTIGILLQNSNFSRIAWNDVHDNENAGVYILDASYRNTVNGTSSYRNDNGFYIKGSFRNTIDRSNASDNSQYGFYMHQASNNSITNSNADLNDNGFGINDSYRNTIDRSNASDNSQYGFYAYQAHDNNITNSNADLSQDGFYISSNSYSNRAYNCTSSSNTGSGFSVSGYNNTLANSVSFANQWDGFTLSGENNTLLDNTAYGQTFFSSSVGMYITGNNTVDRNSHYYSNSVDYFINPSLGDPAIFINATNISIDNPSGGYANYTMLSFSDTAQGGEGYTIQWVANTYTPPQGRTSFRGKFVNITKVGGIAVSIDSITWAWKDSELGGYEENFFELWKYNTTWTLLNSTPDTATNTLTLKNMNPVSEYGILQIDCPVITRSGSYRLAYNVAGAPNDASPLSDYVCVKIAASNVLYDCNGYNITGNGTGTYAILVNGSYNNVTIRNCPGISNYSNGVYLYHAINNTVHNCSAFGIGGTGFRVQGGTGNVIENCTAYNILNSGFRVDGYAVGTRLRNNLAYNSTDFGFMSNDATYTDFTNNTAYNQAYGFLLQVDNNYTLLTDNTAFNNTYGFYLAYNIFNVSLVNNAAYNNILSCFHFAINATNNSIVGNTASGCQDGFLFTDNSNYNTLTGNFASDNSDYAVYINSSSGITLSGMVMSNQTSLIGPPGGSPIEITNLTAESGTSSVVFGSVDYSSGSALNESNLIIKYGMVALDSSASPEFNTSARITMWTPSCSPPIVYVLEEFPVTRYDVLGRGRVCTEPDCTIISCIAHTIVFDVAHFSGYASGGENGLTITNDGPKYAYEEITFNAEYVNTTDSSPILGADCNLSLWNGSTYTMTEDVDHYELSLNVTDIGAHSYNVTCSKAGFTTLTAFDTFTIFYNGTLSGVDLSAMNVTVISDSRYGGNVAANHTTEGGNVSEVNLTGNVSTDRWAGYYGNITAGIVLAQSGDTQMMYNWTWDSSYGGVVCASTGSTPLSAIMGATYADIDTAWSFTPTASDSAEKTFSNANCSQSFGTANMSDAYYADTGLAGGFITCAWKSAAAPSKAEMLFCTDITQNGPIYNGETGDFELISPAAYGTGVYETYYFYVSLG